MNLESLDYGAQEIINNFVEMIRLVHPTVDLDNEEWKIDGDDSRFSSFDQDERHWRLEDAIDFVNNVEAVPAETRAAYIRALREC